MLTRLNLQVDLLQNGGSRSGDTYLLQLDGYCPSWVSRLKSTCNRNRRCPAQRLGGGRFVFQGANRLQQAESYVAICGVLARDLCDFLPQPRQVERPIHQQQRAPGLARATDVA